MRSVENFGLGASTPVLTQPGRVPLLRMLFKGQRGGPRACESGEPSMHYNPAMAVDVCDADGSPGMQCSVQSPVTAMSGLGMVAYSNSFCLNYDKALESIKKLLAEAERVGVVDTIEYEQAAALLKREESWIPWEHAGPVLPATCEKETLRATGLYSALNDAIRAAGGRPGAEEPPGGGGDNSGNTVRTVAIVAGITVAVGGIIYLVGPFVRAAAKAGARRLK